MALERVRHFPHPMMFEQGDLCISLYQQTHRYDPENRRDPIVFKNLLQQIENILEPNYKKDEIQTLLLPLHELREDKHFWNNTLDGLAILLRPGRGILYQLARPVQNIAIVSDTFHLVPLLRAYQSAESYQVLALNAIEFKLYEGSRYELEAIKLPPEVPTTITEILGEETASGYLNFRTSRAGGPTMYHGQGGRKEDAEKDLVRFFRHVDSYVLDEFSKPMELPLVLVALTEHQGEFRKITNNSFLLPEGVSSSPDSMSVKELATQSWEILLESYLQKTKKLVDNYLLAQARFLAGSDVTDIAQAVFSKRVKTLIVEDGKILPGRYDSHTGKVEHGQLEDPLYGNVFDRLILHVLQDKGEVVVLPTDRMPSNTGIAAIYRYS